MAQRRVTPKKAAPKPKAWQPPAGLKIEVGCYRGDVSLKSEATVADAVPVALLLVAMMREVAKQAPDTLPYADSVPGAVIAYDWAEEYEGRAERPVVGFTRSGPRR